MTIPITPKTDTPLPYDDADDVVPSLIEQIAVSGNTAELQMALGAPLELTAKDGAATTELFRTFLEAKDPRSLENRGVAFTAAQFLREYAHNVAIDVTLVRTAITTKLMEIANCGDKKYELRALELLGKHRDVGLFTDRSEITIKTKSAEDLEREIKERVQRLLHAEVYDTTPIVKGLDEDIWGKETLKAFNELPEEPVHPGWDGPARALPPEETDDFPGDDRFDE